MLVYKKFHLEYYLPALKQKISENEESVVREPGVLIHKKVVVLQSFLSSIHKRQKGRPP